MESSELAYRESYYINKYWPDKQKDIFIIKDYQKQIVAPEIYEEFDDLAYWIKRGYT